MQIVQILREALSGHPSTLDGYQQVVVALRKEYGVFFLAPNLGTRAGPAAELEAFVLSEGDVDRVLDSVELSCLFMERLGQMVLFAGAVAGAILELNTRFREHDVGYQFEDGELIRVDSQLLHAEVVKPALTLLSSGDYDGAQEEFLKAHEHYRHGRTKEAMTECLKALESVMKTICAKRQWTVDPNASAKTLIDVSTRTS